MHTTRHILPLPPFFFLFFFLFSFTCWVHAQPSTIGYNCTAPPSNQSSPSSCQTYVFYRAASPDYLDLAAVGDLFSVSRLMISRPSNISAANATLAPGQPLLVPVTCSCNAVNANVTISYASVNYTILGGDTFYRVSTLSFQNLTTYQSVEVVNPTFEPTRLEIGDVIVFPIFCRCPNSSQERDRVNYLISYVFQPADRLSDVASRLGSTQQSIIDANGNNIQPYDTIFVPVSRLPNLTQPAVAPPNPNNGSNNTNNNNSSTNTDSDNRGLEIGLGVALGICGIGLILVSAMWWYRERMLRMGKGEFYRADGEKMERGRIGSSLKAEEVNLMADVSGCLDKYRVFGIEDMKKATEGFDDKRLIQGSVYKGCIDGEFFAIKKMKWNAYEELKILQKVNHGNLVRLEGFCIDPHEANCYLVYEYVDNGSLHSWLHDPARPEKLSWKTRLQIAIDVANGLQYIHEHTRPRVVHKDIKSSNILLDNGFRAKVANFGLARSGHNAMTAHVIGTQGYMAPEYLSDGVISTKTDVFAFGVVLLELVSGRQAVDERGEVLWAGARGLLDGGSEGRALREWVDAYVAADDMESAVGVLGLGVACVDRDPVRRPSMVEIVYALSKSGDSSLDLSEERFSPRPVVAR